MFTPTLRCECAQPASDRLMRKWCIGLYVRDINGSQLAKMKKSMPDMFLP